METYTQYKELQSKQNAIVDALSDKLNSYPKGDFGLIPDSITGTTEFKDIKNRYKLEFKKLQIINSEGVKKFKKEIQVAYQNRITKN